MWWRSKKAGKSFVHAKKAAGASCSVQAERTEYDVGQYEKDVSTFSVCFLFIFFKVYC